MPMHIRKAVIPVAGFGTRLLPATRVVPKELLTLVDKPLIQWIIDEVAVAGIEEVILVNSPHKKMIEAQFSDQTELYKLFKKKNNSGVNADLITKPDALKISSVYQDEALGLGHAVHCAQHLVGDEAFAVLLPDVIVPDGGETLRGMVQTFDKKNSSIIALAPVPASEADKYGIAELAADDRITCLVEKPPKVAGEVAQSVLGRYLFTNSIFHYIQNTAPGALGEIQLTDAMKSQLEAESIYGYKYHGRLFDCGNKLGLLKANLALALEDDRFGQEMHRFIQDTTK